ncbi:hypothetical protein [Fluviicola taffensis]|uniref:Outer membrane protein beta-barrel domain-containing protein n=1 Tax=Fluviicola taffensis (strain DSM 16823 / NCIMB 13979 / RW262) TaxID=755732 RepID=F2IIK9_FLUTR|nr:hypothetical protein [Fluviicola taffensis]AEA45971.1 hypothetical protein Fluta_4009 [Fluviicola taffensis DSM 16823]
MRTIFTLLLLLLVTTSSFSQEDRELYVNDEEELTKKPAFEPHNEIGGDIHFSASTFGGTGGIGLKFGIVRSQYISFGPSARFHYSYFKNNGLSGSYSVYGGGVFVHGRFFNYLFIGLEFELLSNPYSNGNGVISAKRTWAPTGLLGGGFSHAFGKEENFRLNAGIMYDVIDNVNSPFRPGYFMRKQTANGTPGALIPLIYRIAVFFKI